MAKRTTSRGMRKLAGGAGPSQARGVAAGPGGQLANRGVGSGLLAALAARVWAEVTDGKGVVVDRDGEEIKPGGAGS
jgi:hypothetical protein